jgi:hypothetical protein
VRTSYPVAPQDARRVAGDAQHRVVPACGHHRCPGRHRHQEGLPARRDEVAGRDRQHLAERSDEGEGPVLLVRQHHRPQQVRVVASRPRRVPARRAGVRAGPDGPVGKQCPGSPDTAADPAAGSARRRTRRPGPARRPAPVQRAARTGRGERCARACGVGSRAQPEYVGARKPATEPAGTQ